MPKSLSELQQSPDVGLPQRTVKVCVAARLVDELEPIQRELIELETQIEEARQADRERREDGTGRPKRIGERSAAAELEKQADELAEKGDAIRARIEEHTVELQLAGKTQGEWREWARRHPARDEDEDRQGADRDRVWAAGACNIDALVTDLRMFTAKYNGEDASDAWAEFLAANGAPAHLTNAASNVVAMHERVVDAGKSLRAWLDSRRSATGSE